MTKPFLDAEPHAEVLHNPDTTERSSSLPQNLELANRKFVSILYQ